MAPEKLPVQVACRILGVSESGYYGDRKHPPSGRSIRHTMLTNNGRFWNGLDDQLLSYMRSDACEQGHMVVIRYRNNPASATRMRELSGRVARAAATAGTSLTLIGVDGRRPVSASKI